MTWFKHRTWITEMRLLILVFCWVLLPTTSLLAFEEQVLEFVPDTEGGTPVRFVYTGANFDPALDVFIGGQSISAEEQEFVELFKSFHEANVAGDKSSILGVWQPKDRNDVEALMDPESLADNKARFQIVKGLRLKTIMEFGAHYICYVEFEFDGYGKRVQIYPVTRVNEQLFLSNGLLGDYFTSVIAGNLDKSNHLRNQ